MEGSGSTNPPPPDDEQPPPTEPLQPQPPTQPWPPPQQQQQPPPPPGWGQPPPQGYPPAGYPPQQPPPQWGQGPPQPPYGPPPTQQGGGRNWLPWAILAGLLIIGIVVGGVLLLGKDDTAEAQTVRFQPPTSPGPHPFTKPTDVHGKTSVDVGSGPFGGTGSDLVCNRVLLIRALRLRPDRLRAWANTLGIEPTYRSVARYIRRLRPVTLTRDTRVTNHSFENGQAVAFQSILQAGTAVLVDKYGTPVARCRCGNPLTKPIYIPEAVCLYCPPRYEPPPPCRDYRDCYRRYPNPPPVCCTSTTTTTSTTETTTTETPPPSRPASAFFTPRTGRQGDTYTLHASGFPPNTQLTIDLTRPDGRHETHTFGTDSAGEGAYTFPRAQNPILGTYTARVTGGGESATALTTVIGEPQPQQQQPQQTTPQSSGGSGLQCNPPRSQLEFEQCRDAGQLPAQQP